MNWHQQKAVQRAHKLRNTPAHILRSDYIATGRTLCGLFDPSVYITADKRDNPENMCCLRCKRIADRSATLGEAINLWRDDCCEWLYVFSPEDGWHRYAI